MESYFLQNAFEYVFMCTVIKWAKTAALMLKRYETYCETVDSSQIIRPYSDDIETGYCIDPNPQECKR